MFDQKPDPQDLKLTINEFILIIVSTLIVIGIMILWVAILFV